jgi:hypothetical protein
MPATALEDLQHQIAQHEHELERLHQELQARQNRLSELTRQKDTLENELRQVEEEIAALGAAPQAAREPPEPATPVTASTPGQPRLRDLVVAMLSENKEPMTPRQLCEGAQRRGYKPTTKDPLASVKARLQEMRTEGIIQRASGQPGYILVASTNGTSKKSKPQPSTSNGTHQAGSKPARTKTVGKKSAKAAPSAKAAKTPESAQQGKQPTLRDVLTLILGKSRRLLSASELAQQVLATGYKSESKDFTNVIWVGLGKMDNVERVPGKGYRLKTKA